MNKKRLHKTARTHRPIRRRRPAPPWSKFSDEKLLDVRLCDLGLKIEGTVVERRIRQVYSELARKGFRFRPHFWLSSEWFTPDGIPGVAIPFYLAHPRLMKLEEQQMLEVEGGTRQWCMKLLRHEVGHALDNAYLLHRRRQWQRLFGKASTPYPECYQPRPFSRRYVLHLDSWYAQSHPSEDFAETFAVWLTPGSRWRMRYLGWPALQKLEYVDQLMAEIVEQKPRVTVRRRPDSLPNLTTTLRQHYQHKRERYGVDYPEFYDRDLRKLFSDAPEYRRNRKAAAFLRRTRPQIRRMVARWTGEYQYTIDQVLLDMIDRCKELDLRLVEPAEESTIDALMLVTVQTMNYLHQGHHRVAM